MGALDLIVMISALFTILAGCSATAGRAPEETETVRAVLTELMLVTGNDRIGTVGYPLAGSIRAFVLD